MYFSLNFIIMFFSFMSISLFNVQYMWFFLFLNLILFIFSEKNNSFMFKFFIIQEMCSVFMFFSLMYLNMYFLFFSIMMKMGITPMEKWFLNMMKKINWEHFLCFLGTFKIIPFYILNNLMMNYHYMFIFIFFIMTMYKLITNINELNIFLYSSIFSNLILLLCSMFNISLSFLFFMMYIMLLMSFNNKINMNKYLSMVIMFFSLPPSSLFFIKYLMMMYMIKNMFMNYIMMFILSLSMISYIWLFFKFYINSEYKMNKCINYFFFSLFFMFMFL